MKRLLLFLVASCRTLVSSHFFVDIEDGLLTTPQLATKYGYRTEVHKVETYDGYVVELHRIKASPSTGSFDPRKRPVLMMHGMMGSSGDWILIGPHNALPYLLSDLGYDVWLGNARGNRYSREHSYLTEEMEEFWDFSWHEMGIYDGPRMIDYILETRRVRKLHYVGHSQGTTMFFVMTSMMPHYNEKIVKMHALAPAAYLHHMSNPVLRFLASHLETLTYLVHTLGGHQFAPTHPIFHHIASFYCPNVDNEQYCINTMFVLSSGEFHQLDPKIIPIILGHLPAGSSTKQVIHYVQGINSGHFRQFDYGTDNNTEIYHSLDPPVYNLSNIRAPIAIYYGLNDQLTHPTDVGRLAQELPNVVSMYQLPNASFNHMDFLLAPFVKDVLYKNIIASIEEDS